jgi:2-hydroxycyclohexanecarboxyl-CoA dehydrogenase
MRGLKGKRVIVTGAAKGIGRAIAGRLAAEGCVLGILDRDGEAAEAAAQAIRDAGGTAHVHAVDIVDHEAVEAAVAAFETAAGGIDGLVNNAGWDKAANFLDTAPEDWRKVIDINLYGPLNVTHAVLRRMRAQGSGRVVSIASDAGRVGSSGEAVYSACKGGIIAITKTIARELAKTGITLNCVSPGPTDTEFLQSFDPDGKLKAALERAIPMRRLGQPEDYPGIVALLLSDDAGFITGQVISVSGGLSMHG